MLHIKIPKDSFQKTEYFLTSQSFEIMNFPNWCAGPCVSVSWVCVCRIERAPSAADGDWIFLCLLLWIVAGSAWLKLSCQSNKWETGLEVQGTRDGGTKQEMETHWKERGGGRRDVEKGKTLKWANGKWNKRDRNETNNREKWRCWGRKWGRKRERWYLTCLLQWWCWGRAENEEPGMHTHALKRAVWNRSALSKLLKTYLSWHTIYGIPAHTETQTGGPRPLPCWSRTMKWGSVVGRLDTALSHPRLTFL